MGVSGIAGSDGVRRPATEATCMANYVKIGCLLGEIGVGWRIWGIVRGAGAWALP